MQTVQIIVGTMLGAAEYVAETAQRALEQNGFKTELYLQTELGELNPEHIWLVCTSTHGAGDFPDNIQPLMQELEEQRPDLSKLRFGVIGLGDSSYDTFCFAGKNSEKLLSELGGTLIGERLDIDVSKYAIPEDAAEEWLPGWIQAIG